MYCLNAHQITRVQGGILEEAQNWSYVVIAVPCLIVHKGLMDLGINITPTIEWLEATLL